eukprot:scpid101978/ scgid27725/ 
MGMQCTLHVQNGNDSDWADISIPLLGSSVSIVYLTVKETCSLEEAGMTNCNISQDNPHFPHQSSGVVPHAPLSSGFLQTTCMLPIMPGASHAILGKCGGATTSVEVRRISCTLYM